MYPPNKHNPVQSAQCEESVPFHTIPGERDCARDAGGGAEESHDLRHANGISGGPNLTGCLFHRYTSSRAHTSPRLLRPRQFMLAIAHLVRARTLLSILPIASVQARMMESFPEGYVPPAVWKPKVLGGKMGDMNRPTAGARKEQTLQVGEHALQLYSLGTPNGMKVTILLEELNEIASAY